MKKTTSGLLALLFIGSTCLQSEFFLKSYFIENIVQKVVNQNVNYEIILQEALTSYADLIKNIRDDQIAFQKRYSEANANEKKEIIMLAEEYVHNALLSEVFPLWVGTPWAFHGHASTPHYKQQNPTVRQSISCGHFVTRALTDVGFNIERVKLAQMPSETMIRNLIQPENIFRYRNRPIDFIVNELEKLPSGLYITGLDIHTGFVLNEPNNLKFIHSSYYPDVNAVVIEPLKGNNPFTHSRYRVLGKIDEEMIKYWLENKKIKIKYN